MERFFVTWVHVTTWNSELPSHLEFYIVFPYLFGVLLLYPGVSIIFIVSCCWTIEEEKWAWSRWSRRWRCWDIQNIIVVIQKCFNFGDWEKSHQPWRKNGSKCSRLKQMKICHQAILILNHLKWIKVCWRAVKRTTKKKIGLANGMSSFLLNGQSLKLTIHKV